MPAVMSTLLMKYCPNGAATNTDLKFSSPKPMVLRLAETGNKKELTNTHPYGTSQITARTEANKNPMIRYIFIMSTLIMNASVKIPQTHYYHGKEQQDEYYRHGSRPTNVPETECRFKYIIQ